MRIIYGASMQINYALGILAMKVTPFVFFIFTVIENLLEVILNSFLMHKKVNNNKFEKP